MEIEKDLLRPLQKHKGLEIWLLFLLLILSVAFYGYFIQLRDGLGVTGMRDFVSWGMYIGNFVFFVAVSLVGMLISSVLSLLDLEWSKPISRIAEIIALAFVMSAGLVIVFDMGRPDRLLNVIIHGRIQSPIVWDITVITTYIAISFLLYFLPLLPDIAILRKNLTNIPKWQKFLYKILSFNWKNNPEQRMLLHKAIKILAILIVPVALAIHTVTSWLFAATLRPAWDSTIFGPYFVSGAFVAGSAIVILAMYFFRNNFQLKNYLTDKHFDKMGKLLVLTSLLYLYFNINEYLVPFYKMRSHEAHVLHDLFAGRFAIMFWLVQIFGLIIPTILLIFKKMRKPKILTFISLIVLICAFFKRYLIVVPTMQHPHLPIQNVPENFEIYSPTGIEIAVTIGTVAIALLLMTIFAKLFPVISIWETREHFSKNEKIE